MSEATRSSSAGPERRARAGVRAPLPGSPGSGIALGWKGIAHLAAKKEVPIHRYTIFYYLGGMALFLFLVQVATGILLLLYYRPSAAEAFESVQYIMAEVPFGWLIRSIHSWGANLFVGVVVPPHGLRLLPEGLPRAARDDLDLGSPAALPRARLRLLRLPAALEQARLLRHEGRHRRAGADSRNRARCCRASSAAAPTSRGPRSRASTGSTSRSFPPSRRSLLGVHLFLVQKKGMSVPPSVERRPRSRVSMQFVPDFLLRDMVGWLIAVGLLAALAAFFPWELGEKADPFAPGAGRHPARVVLPLDVPGAEVPARRDRRRARRDCSASSSSACSPRSSSLVPLLDRGGVAREAFALVEPLRDRRADGRARPDGPRAAAAPGWPRRERPLRRLRRRSPRLAAAAPRPRRLLRPSPPPRSGCVDCHLALDDARVSPPATAFADDIHARSGLHVRVLPRRRPARGGPGGRPRPPEAIPRQAFAAGHPGAVRELPLRRRRA